MTRPAPTLRVQLGQEIVLRAGVLEVLARDASGRATIGRMRPQLRPGEILCERYGDIPMIVTEAEGAAMAPTPAPPEHPHFDAWYGNRISTAHAMFMERTSRHPACDWRMIGTGTIARYLNGTIA